MDVDVPRESGNNVTVNSTDDDIKSEESPIKPPVNRPSLTGQIYGSIMNNLTDGKEPNGINDEKMETDCKPVVIPNTIDFCRVRFLESGIKREIYSLKELTRKDGSYVKERDAQ